MKIKRNNLVANVLLDPRSLGIVGYIVLLTVALPLTTYAVREISENVRLIAVLLTVIGLVSALFRPRLNRVTVTSIVLFVFLYGYATILGLVFGGYGISGNAVPITILVVIMGLVLFASTDPVLDNMRTLAVFWYILAFCGLTWYFGGLRLDYPPRFFFEVQTDRHGSLVAYNQGVSKFFGIGAILSVFLMVSAKATLARVFFGFMGLFFLGLSLLGGARGDSLAALFCIVLAFGPRSPFRFAAIIGVVVIVWVLASAQFSADDFVIARRMENVFAGSIGVREAIF
jgi:hypothetical protein